MEASSNNGDGSTVNDGHLSPAGSASPARLGVAAGVQWVNMEDYADDAWDNLQLAGDAKEGGLYAGSNFINGGWDNMPGFLFNDDSSYNSRSDHSAATSSSNNHYDRRPLSFGPSLDNNEPRHRALASGSNNDQHNYQPSRIGSSLNSNELDYRSFPVGLDSHQQDYQPASFDQINYPQNQDLHTSASINYHNNQHPFASLTGNMWLNSPAEDLHVQPQVVTGDGNHSSHDDFGSPSYNGVVGSNDGGRFQHSADGSRGHDFTPRGIPTGSSQGDHHLAPHMGASLPTGHVHRSGRNAWPNAHSSESIITGDDFSNFDNPINFGTSSAETNPPYIHTRRPITNHRSPNDTDTSTSTSVRNKSSHCGVSQASRQVKRSS